MCYKDKIRPLFFLFSLFLTGLFFNVQNVYATDYFTDNFDSYTNGTDLNGQNSWSTYNGGVFVRNSQSVSVPNSIEVVSQSIARRAVQSLSSGSFRGSVKIVPSSGQGQLNIGLRKDSNSAYACTFTIDYATGKVYKDIETYKTEILSGFSFGNWNDWSVSFRTSDDSAMFCIGSTCSTYSQCRYGGVVSFTNIDGINFKGADSITTSAFIDNVLYNDVEYSGLVNGTCGLDNGQTISSEPPTPPLTLCSTGTATTVLYSDYSWFWTCEGSGGGTTANCISYETFVPATCGADNGQTVSEVDDFCSYGSLIMPSFVETITGWNWTCQRDSTYAYCSAIRGGITPPELPEQEDCSTLSVPDIWFCQISNAVQGAFLPTPSKLNELNTTVNLIGQRFPFNYITSAKYSIETISISTALPSITIMGNTGALNINAISNFATVVRNGTSILIIFAFLFWLIGYIKNFFR